MRYILNEKVLQEGTKYDKKAAQKLADSGLFDLETSKKIVDGLFREDIHAFVHAPAWLEKYLVGIVNMLIKHCNGDPSKALGFLTDSLDIFNNYLTWVKENRPGMDEKLQQYLDKEFNEKMSFEDLEKKLDDIMAERDRISSDELKDMLFKNSSNFELIPIDSFNEFNSKFGGSTTGDGSSDEYAGDGGTAWCHANSESTYDSWVKGNKNKFFVLANRDWKNIPFDVESNSNNPKDDYGNSLIALLVNKMNGRLLNSTLRCNHVGVDSNADNQYTTYAELSKIAGFNVEEKVKEYLGDSIIDISDTNNIWKTFDGSHDSLNDILDILGISRKELTDCEIPNSVTSIGLGAFYDCRSLTNIIIPNSVTEIGDRAFCECYSLTDITIPDGVTKIGYATFWDCRSLTNIIIPNSVTEIGRRVFQNCKSLTNITIPDGVTEIGWGVFQNCKSLTSVTIPNSVASIGEEAFIYCESLTDIIIPNSVTKIGNAAFYECYSLTNITISNSITEIGDYAFGYCSSLTNMTIPNSVTEIGEWAFLGCRSLTNITIPNSVTHIGEKAFLDCVSLIIHCKKGSYAEEYAIKYNIPVKYLYNNESLSITEALYLLS